MSADIEAAGSLPYEQIVKVLQERRQALEDVPLRLPSEVVMGEQYGVSRGTVRRALSVLERQGGVVRRPKRGTYLQPLRLAVSDTGTQHIGVIFPWWADTVKIHFTAMVFDGISRWSGRTGCRTSVLHADQYPNEHAIWQELGNERDIHGLIWIQPHEQQLGVIKKLAMHIPTAIVGRPCADIPAVQVIPDYNHAAALIDERLVELGHQQYVVIGKNIMSSASQVWIKAFQKVYRRRNAEFRAHERFLDYQPFGNQSLAKLVRLHLEERPYLQAYVALTSSNLQQLLADDRLRTRIGKDLSLIVWDYGSAAIESYWPGTAIDHATCDWSAIGRHAAELLSLRISGHDVPQIVHRPVSFVNGDTCAPYRTSSQG